MSIEESLDRVASNLALIAGAISTLAEAVNGTYKGKQIYTSDTPEAPAPKARRGRSAAATSTAGSSDPTASATAAAAPAAATTVTADPPAAPVAAAAPAAPAGDIFGAPSVAAASPTPPTAPAEAPKKQLSDKEHLELVRSALVDVQTGYKSRDKAMELLAKYAPNTKTTGELKPEHYDKLIQDCKNALLALPPA